MICWFGAVSVIGERWRGYRTCHLREYEGDGGTLGGCGAGQQRVRQCVKEVHGGWSQHSIDNKTHTLYNSIAILKKILALTSDWL